ncbi:MAG: hypothetical protein ABI378_07380 [Chitinophagaceae bacterium]
MSEHDTHQGEAENADRKKSKSSFRSSFWFVIILVGLFIGALNFIKAMSHGEEGHEATEPHTEMTAPAPATPATETAAPAATSENAPAAEKPAEQAHH